MTYDVYGIESGCLDLNVCIDEMPQLNRGTRVQDLTWQGGGKVSTGLVAAARLGARCAISGTFGNDRYGKICREDFIRHGVDVSNLYLQDGAYTSLSVVIAERKSATRTIFFRAGNGPRMTEEEVNWDLLRSSKVLLIAGIYPLTLAALRYAKEAGVKVVIDADGYQEDILGNLDKIDAFVGSEFCFDGLFPGAKEKGLDQLLPECRSVYEKGPEIVVFTFGEKGCIGYDGKEYFVIPAFPVDAVDTVGAGDVFHGAFSAFLAQGRSARECAYLSSAVSAIKCTRIGGRAGIPTMDVLEKYIETGVIDYSEIDVRTEQYRDGIELGN